MAFKWGSNALLNKPGHHTTAAIATYLRIYTGEKHMTCTVTISDCDRTINLEFGTNANKQAEFDNGVYKFDVLISELKKARKQYKRAWKKELKRNG